jgi:hypothetical protein
LFFERLKGKGSAAVCQADEWLYSFGQRLVLRGQTGLAWGKNRSLSQQKKELRSGGGRAWEASLGRVC